MFPAVTAVLFALVPALAAADASDKQEASVIEKAFKSADTDSDQQLDEKEVREARRILRGAVLAALPNDVPGGKATRDRIEDLISKPIKGSKDGSVSRPEFTKFAESVFDARDAILKDARKKEADDLAKQRQREEELRRKAREQAEKERQKHNKRQHKHKKK